MNKLTNDDAPLVAFNTPSKRQPKMNLKTIAILLLLSSSILHSQEEKFSGTFQNDPHGTLIFYANGNVDCTFKGRFLKKGVAVASTKGSGSAAVVEERDQTIRGTFQVVKSEKMREVISQIMESDPSKDLSYFLNNYTEIRGYNRWVVIAYPKGGETPPGWLFVLNGRTLVDALSGVIYKQPWYSRTRSHLINV